MNMNIAFFSTSDKSFPILETIHKDFHLAVCITKPDVVIGRKKLLRENATKTFCKRNNIPYLEIDNLKSTSGASVLEALSKYDVQIGIVADFAFIIPEDIFNKPELGLINIHFSKLPQYRGASPVQFTIKDRCKVAGISLHLIDKGMDTGDIIFQTEVELEGNENSEILYNKLFKYTSTMITQILHDYSSNKLLPTKQNEAEATYTRSLNNPKITFIQKEDAEIKWNYETQDIEASIRAFYPWPIAWTYLKNTEHNDKLMYNLQLKPKIDKNTKIKIYTAKIVENKLLPIEIQLENKNKILWDDFLNGYVAN